MTPPNIAQQVAEALDAGKGAALGAETYLPLVELDSGARCGLDHQARWIFVPDDGRPPTRFDASAAYVFHEVLERRRSKFDDDLAAAATALGLPADDVVWSFPAIEVVRSVLAKEHPYMARLALEWIGPTELRPLRAEIRAIAQVKAMPVSLRELAERLIVPE